jgi:outer membrane protein
VLKKTVSKILFLIVSFTSLNGYAGKNCDTLSALLNQRPMTLIELTDVALTCNPSTHISWAETKVAFANLGITSSAFWPQLNGIGTIQGTSNSSSEGASVNTGSATGNKSASNSNHEIIYGPGVSVSYVLWDFGVRNQQVKAANYQLQAAKFTQHSVMQQVILQVEQVYYQVLGQKAAILALIESVNENKKNLSTANALRREGLAVIGDVYQAESALGQSQLNLEQATGNLKILEGQLALAIGVPTETTIKLSSLSEKIESKLIFQSIELLMDNAKETRSDFLASEAQVKAAEAELEAAKRQRWPTIQLDVTAQRLNTNLTRTANRTGSALLTFSIPIFSGFSQEYSIMQAKAMKEQAENQRELLGQQIRSQVWQAYYQLKTADQSIETSRELLKSSLQAAKQAYGQYQAGVGNILTVLTTQAVADTARAEVIQAKLNWFSALAQFSYALGKLDV